MIDWFFTFAGVIYVERICCDVLFFVFNGTGDFLRIMACWVLLAVVRKSGTNC